MALDDVLAIILGGGRGTRLYPLTKLRTKPAVPLAGNYRLIDIPISNCINSGVRRIFVLTQFLSASLLRHVQQTYKFDVFSEGFVDILPAEQTLDSSDWYQGTADAVRRQFRHFESRGAKDALILAGDHLYRMDYARFVAQHRAEDADLTIAVLPVSADDASRFGILKLDELDRIERFEEKPTDPAVLRELESNPGSERPFLGSMGIYVFRMEFLRSLLETVSGDDFGKHLIPAALAGKGLPDGRKPRVCGHRFEGYWEDIGTLSSFYHANMALTRPDRPFDFYDPKHPIYSRPRFLPASRVDGCWLRRVVLADGCRLYDAQLDECVIGLRSTVRPGAQLQRVIMLGADDYEDLGQKEQNRAAGIPQLGIGEGSVIERALIDKNARIGRNVVIRSHKGRPDEEHEGWVVRDGFVVVMKNAVIPDGTVIE